jgi:hypothetical protein
MNYKILLIMLLGFMGVDYLNAQKPESTTSDASSVNRVQPIIMVIPYTKEGEDIRKVLEADIARRVAVAKIKESFDNRGFTTRDFVATLKAVATDGAFTGDNQTDLKSQIIEASGADIYVEVEVYEQKSGNGNSARLILSAYDAFTAFSLSNKTGSSGQFYTDDFSRLVERCLKQKGAENQPEMLEDFLNVMQTKFTDVVKNGRSVTIRFSLSQDAAYTFDTEFGEKSEPLSDVLETWMGNNAYKNYYNPPKTTAKLVLFDAVRIPLRDDNNRNYTPSKFANAIYKYCNSLVPSENKSAKLKVGKDVRGGTIYITIQ